MRRPAHRETLPNLQRGGMNKPRFPILAAAAAVLALFAFGLGAASAADEEEEAPDYV